MRKKQILAIIGSVRSDSSNEKIIRVLMQLYSETCEFTVYDGITRLPYFTPGLKEDELPLSVLEFLNRIQESDAVIVCTPEYVFSLPGVLKNALEWTVQTTVFSEKTSAFIVASASGEKAFESIDLILTTLGAKIPEQAKLLFKSAKSLFDETGKLKDEEKTKALRTLMESIL